MRLRLRALFPLVVACSLAAAPSASANAFQDLFKEYQRTGTVNGCKNSAKDLKKAKGEVPNDIEQYAPDFPAALDAALAQRASGKCSKKGSSGSPAAVAPTTTTPSGTAGPTATTGAPTTTPSTTTTTPAGTATAPAPAPDATPAPPVADDAINAAAQTSDSGADNAPAALVLLFVLGALLLLGALAWVATSWWAWEPAWLVRARHSGSEAGWRASAAWAEFTDWVRLGK
jgi:cobalamin biosynthesis Mg chelatase CobN